METEELKRQLGFIQEKIAILKSMAELTVGGRIDPHLYPLEDNEEYRYDTLEDLFLQVINDLIELLNEVSTCSTYALVDDELGFQED